MNVKEVAFAVPNTLTKIMDIDVQHFLRAGFSLKDAGAQALSAFQIVGKFHEDGPEEILASASGDFTTPDGVVILKANGDPTLLAAGATAWFLLDIEMLHRLIFYATCANVAGTTVDLYGVQK